jgi:hypothetical protein
MPTSFAASHIRTAPATLLRSVTPMAESPSTDAVAASSSGDDAPRRKENALATWSSA